MRFEEFDSWITFKVDGQRKQALKRVAFERDLTVSALLREAVEIIVQTEAQEPQNPFIAAEQRRRATA